MTFVGVDREVTVGPMPPWEACRDCSGGPAPGAVAMVAYWLESYEGIARSLGIYNCRPVRGSSSLSVHACGRAADLGVPVTAEGHEAAYEFLRRLSPHLMRLGVPYFIFNRRQWSARRDPAGELYAGVHPHADHIHLELTAEAGRRLTLATLRAVVGDFRVIDPPIEPKPPVPPVPPKPPVPPVPPKPPVPPVPPRPQGVLAVLPTLNFATVGSAPRTWLGRPGAPNHQVRALQGLLAALGLYRGKLDGLGGPATRTAVGSLQRTFRTGRPGATATLDFIVGDRTWRAALRVL
jgi:hypothetical protein